MAAQAVRFPPSLQLIRILLTLVTDRTTKKGTERKKESIAPHPTALSRISSYPSTPEHATVLFHSTTVSLSLLETLKFGMSHTTTSARTCFFLLQ